MGREGIEPNPFTGFLAPGHVPLGGCSRSGAPIAPAPAPGEGLEPPLVAVDCHQLLRLQSRMSGGEDSNLHKASNYGLRRSDYGGTDTAVLASRNARGSLEQIHWDSGPG